MKSYSKRIKSKNYSPSEIALTYGLHADNHSWHDFHFHITYPIDKFVIIKERTFSKAVLKFKKKYPDVSYRLTKID